MFHSDRNLGGKENEGRGKWNKIEWQDYNKSRGLDGSAFSVRHHNYWIPSSISCSLRPFIFSYITIFLLLLFAFCLSYVHLNNNDSSHLISQRNRHLWYYSSSLERIRTDCSVWLRQKLIRNYKNVVRRLLRTIDERTTYHCEHYQIEIISYSLVAKYSSAQCQA